jgi:hypothetical protein
MNMFNGASAEGIINLNIPQKIIIALPSLLCSLSFMFAVVVVVLLSTQQNVRQRETKM